MGKWMRLAAAMLAILVMVWLGYAVVNGMMTVLVGTGMSISENMAERDPMFAEEPEKIERPAELDMEEVPAEHPTLDDYIPEVESPVDMTIEELIQEAENAKI